jgi:hypothetical protein
MTLLGVGQTNVEALTLSLDKLYDLRDSGPGGEHFYHRLFDFCHLQVRITLDGFCCCAAGLCRSARARSTQALAVGCGMCGGQGGGRGGPRLRGSGGRGRDGRRCCWHGLT